MSTEQYQELAEQIVKSQKKWIDPDDLESRYGILKSTQAKMRMKRTLPYAKVGKYVRYNIAEIDAMFAAAKVV